MIGPVDIQSGFRWYDIHGQVRVMAVADGYVMARRPGCGPFVVSIKTIIHNINGKTGAMSLTDSNTAPTPDDDSEKAKDEPKPKT
jgi:hypothetical protein